MEASTGYPSILNHYAESFVDKVKMGVPKDAVWVMTEKIHGANFSFHTDGKSVKVARRSAFLSDQDKFHGSHLFKARYENAVLALHADLGGQSDVVVYGELYGGGYPHKDVKPVRDAKLVQKGLYYAPDLHFTAFDVLTLANGEFLAWDRAAALCVTHGIPFTPLLQQGSLDELLAFNVDTFETRIPDTLALPPLSMDQRIAEGVVIRPLYNFRLFDGQRPLIKKKSKRFREMTGKKARNGNTASAVHTGSANYATEARLRSLLSKGVERQFAHRGHVFELVEPLLVDIIDEMTREQPDLVSLSRADMRLLKNDVADTIKALLQKHADALIAGTF